MELKDFIKKALSEIIEAVDEVSESGPREVHIRSNENHRDIEFDIAVTATSTTTGEAGGGIRVMQFIEAGGSKTNEVTNMTVSRIGFGVNVSMDKKGESSVGVVRRPNYSI